MQEQGAYEEELQLECIFGVNETDRVALQNIAMYYRMNIFSRNDVSCFRHYVVS